MIKLLSVIIPVYNSSDSLDELCETISEVLKHQNIRKEIILIDDCSVDNSWIKIRDLASVDSEIKGLKLSKNFGQHNAITAGIDYANGDWAVFMDCDLQDNPNELTKFIPHTSNSSNIIVGKRTKRKDSLLKVFSSNLFKYFINLLGEIDYDNSSSNYIMCSRKVLDATKAMKERTRSLPLHLMNLGFNRIHIEIDHNKRKHGKSSYNLHKLLNLATDCIISNSNKPLIISIKIGIILSFFSIFFAGYILVKFLSNEILVPGWTTIIILISLLSGLGFINMGVLGLYIGKIYNELKGRPIYVIDEYT
jgi:polyisoprenyl-phosphate glycosyltransferase